MLTISARPISAMSSYSSISNNRSKQNTMKRIILFATLLLTLTFIDAKAQTEEAPKPTKTDVVMRDALMLDINTMTSEQTAQINKFISDHQANRSFWITMGKALVSTLVSYASSITTDEVMKITTIRERKMEAWEEMIENECNYVEDLTYVNSLTDFYSEGSYNGALDPAGLRFNGFTINGQRNGKDVLKFYSHVDTSDEGLCEIYNHSKFRLVLDSMYFYPYQCHLPNWSANQIYLEDDKEYARNTGFSFDERDNLTVSINFDISSSWYNEAIMLVKDVELGSFSIRVPIDKSSLADSVFVYKRDPEGEKALNIAGECFVVPRSFMPLPGGKAHWGTGEYNVKVTVSEHCDLTPEMEENWEKDYRCLRRMKKENKVKKYFINIYEQNGDSVMRSIIESASGVVRDEVGL